jgi:acetate kinase
MPLREIALPKAVLAINAGCSTIKFGLFEIQAARLVLLSKGLLEESGPATNFTARGSSADVLFECAE